MAKHERAIQLVRREQMKMVTSAINARQHIELDDPGSKRYREYNKIAEEYEVVGQDYKAAADCLEADLGERIVLDEGWPEPTGTVQLRFARIGKSAEETDPTPAQILREAAYAIGEDIHDGTYAEDLRKYVLAIVDRIERPLPSESDLT